MTKIAKALAYLQAHPEATTYAAAKHANMRPSPLYAYLKRQKAKTEGVCPTCGKPLDDGLIETLREMVDVADSLAESANLSVYDAKIADAAALLDKLTNE